MRQTQILLVDDSQEILVSVSKALSSFGYKVRTTNNAKDALAILFAGLTVDLVILDLGLPGVDGRYVLERILPGKPPVIIMTGSPDPDDHLGMYIGTKVKRVLKKPCEVAELLEAIKEVEQTITKVELEKKEVPPC